MLPNDHDLYSRQINLLAQGRLDWEQGQIWFSELGDDEKSEASDVVALCCHQSHPKSEEVAPAIKRAGLRDTDTPCVLLRKATVPERAVYRIAGLSPTYERTKAFSLLLSLFEIADARRRAKDCSGGCHHPWHNL